MLYLLALTLAGAAAPAPAGSAAPVAIGTATPFPIPDTAAASQTPAEPLVTPPVPVVPGPASSAGGLPDAGIAGSDAPFVGIALPDAIAMALSRNTDLSVSQSNRRISGFQIVAAEGAYDVHFMLQPSYTVSVQPALSTLQSGPDNGPITEITAAAQAAFSGQTASGGNYKVFTTAQRVDNNFIYDSYNPYYQTALGIAFTQPLARGRAIDDTRRQIAIARINGAYQRDAALLTASNTLDNVVTTYDQLVAAWKSLGISEESLRSAKAQEESNARLARRGAAAPVDVTEADTQVAEFQDDVYSALQRVATLQNQLKGLILANPVDPLWMANLVPTSAPDAAAPEPAVKDLVLGGLAHRPEAGELRESIREEDVNVAYQKDQTKPQVDLNLGVTENGFAGAPLNLENTPLFGTTAQEIADINALVTRANLADPSAPLPLINAAAFGAGPAADTIGTIGQSYGSALRGQYPEYSISATIAFPLRNRTAEANYAAERERRASLQTQEIALIQRVEIEARNAVQGYRSARSRVAASTTARRNAEIVAASEQRKFKAGASTTFLVLQRLVALANTRATELQAQTDLQLALLELERVDGSILSRNNIDPDTLGTAPRATLPPL